MKYIYWVLISLFILWETNALQDIFEFSMVWQYVANIIFIGYFAYLLQVDIPLKKSYYLSKN